MNWIFGIKKKERKKNVKLKEKNTIKGELYPRPRSLCPNPWSVSIIPFFNFKEYLRVKNLSKNK